MMLFDNTRLRRLNAPSCMLGESPMWHPGRGTAMWVDILGNALFEYDLERDQVKQYVGSGMISFIWQVGGHHDLLVVGAQGGVGTFDLRSQELSVRSDLKRAWGAHRCNDGAVDSSGNLWIGTTHVDHLPEGGDLYRVTKGWKGKKKIERLTIPNGMCWSADNKIMYHTDTPARQIKAYAYDVVTGNIVFDWVAVQIPESKGFPDGLAMDTNGTMWVAHWGGSGVGGYNPHTGVLEQWIPIPAPHVSSCAFVGPKLDRLLVTTATKEMSEGQLAQYPQSGDTFLVEMEVPGLPTYDCRLPLK